MGTSLLWLFQPSAQAFSLKCAHPLLHLLKPWCPFKRYVLRLSFFSRLVPSCPCSTTGGCRFPCSLTLDVTTAQTLPPVNHIDSTTPPTTIL
ncbi:hypothetical protein PPACK8108_LOCUS25533 [Phakopsora pachyrhizi]|uniref:Secreted protein n=1 Tax=Phakopsora pachyrhizi TaxID=170000 RepID=A0AAV0BVH0_PHAPC|nr:hypothetical protein PPACK8108_LOCUS25533 [Phakopsora pachyrhizi]